MQFLKKIFFIAFSLVLFSCDKDDDNPNTPVDADSLIGSWTLVSLEADTDLETEIPGFPPVDSSTKSIGENMDYELTFTETEYEVTGGYDLVTNGTVNGEVMDEDRQTISNVSQKGTYELRDGVLILDNSLYELEAAGTEINEYLKDYEVDLSFNSNGELVMREKAEVTFNEEGLALTVDVDADSVWKRK
ncbi:MAG: hypothetical protein AAFX53_17955 [Bacteroidota bacterium]